MDNPEKLETEYKRRRQTKQKHNTISVGHHYIYANKHIRYEPSYKQLEVKMNRTLFLCGNRNGHHNMELRMSRHI
jgi:hypothetical protein